MYISIMAFGQQTINTSRSARLRLRRKRFVEDLMDFEVRMTIRTKTFPITPTARTRLKLLVLLVIKVSISRTLIGLTWFI